MNPQETAQTISTVLAATTVFIGLTALQAWALLAVLSWFGAGVTLNFFQSVVVVLLVRGLLA